MTDIVERLRAYRSRIMSEAADEIERLRVKNRELASSLATRLLTPKEAEIEQLRSMLDKIAKHPDTPELIRQYAVGMLEPKP